MTNFFKCAYKPNVFSQWLMLSFFLRRFHSGSVSQPAPQALAAAPAAPVVTPTAVVVAAPPPASVVQIANAPPLQAEPTPVAIQLPQQPISRPSPPAVAALTAPSAGMTSHASLSLFN